MSGRRAWLIVAALVAVALYFFLRRSQPPAETRSSTDETTAPAVGESRPRVAPASSRKP
jgi:hypothetical protein